MNTGRAVDFMPWLMPPVPAWWRPMRQVREWATGIRDYVERVLVAGPRSEVAKTSTIEIIGATKLFFTKT